MNLEETRARMQKSVEVFRKQLVSILESNISSGYVETIKLQIDNQSVPIGQIAVVNDGKGRVEIQAYNPSQNGTIAKQLQEKGFNAFTFSKHQVVINVPRKTTEETEKICAYVRRLGEDTKVAIRNVRKKVKQSLKGLSREEMREVDVELGEVTEGAIAQVDGLVKWKEGYLRR